MNNEYKDFFCYYRAVPKNDSKECIRELLKIKKLKKDILNKKNIPIFCILKYPVVEQLIDKNTKKLIESKMKDFISLMEKFDFEILSYSVPINLDIHFWYEHYVNSLERKNDTRKEFINKMIQYDLHDSLNIIMLIRYKKLNEKTTVSEIKKKKKNLDLNYLKNINLNL